MKNNITLDILHYITYFTLEQTAEKSMLCFLSASECDGGHDVFATVKENSLMGTFIANLGFTAHPSANHMHLKVSGKDAGWFYLEGRTVRLNSTSTRIIDREVT